MSPELKLIWNPETPPGSRGGPDLGGEVRQRADVVAEDGGGPRELRPGQLHAVARVAGEADRDAVQLADRHVMALRARHGTSWLLRVATPAHRWNGAAQAGSASVPQRSRASGRSRAGGAPARRRGTDPAAPWSAAPPLRPERPAGPATLGPWTDAAAGDRPGRRLRLRLRVRAPLRQERLRVRARLARPPLLAVPDRGAPRLGLGPARPREPGGLRRALAAARPPRSSAWRVLRRQREHVLRGLEYVSASLAALIVYMYPRSSRSCPSAGATACTGGGRGRRSRSSRPASS